MFIHQNKKEVAKLNHINKNTLIYFNIPLPKKHPMHSCALKAKKTEKQ